MKFLNNKTMASLIALVLVLIITATLVALPSANGHTPPWKIPSWSYVVVTPSPIGVGQEALIVFWPDSLPRTASGAYGDRFIWYVEVTRPDSSNETLGPFTSDPVGGSWTLYTPEQVGTYTFVAKLQEHLYTGYPTPNGALSTNAYVNDTYLASSSDPATLTVQQEPIKSFEGTPLPEDYWTRPIHAMNREWTIIAGNWLGGGNPDNGFNKYTAGPESAHIVWTKPTQFGGIVGGDYGDNSYHTGSAYETMWTAGIIIQGRLYYNEPKSPRNGWYCVDLRTGEEIFYNNGTGPIQIGSQTGAHIGATNIPWQYPQLSFGQIYEYDSPNQHGARAYLWSTYTSTGSATYNYTMQNGTAYSFSAPAGHTVWQMYDAFTGKWICNIANIPSGTRTTGPNGEILIYTYNTNGWLSLWNSSEALGFPNNNLGVPYTSGEAFYWMWREPIGRTVDATKGYSWNITVPKSLGSMNQILSDRIIGSSGFTTYGMNAYSVWALDLKPTTAGTLLWKKDYTQPPVANTTLTIEGADEDAGIFVVSSKETRTWYGYDLDTGNQVWGPTPSQHPYDMYGLGGSIAYGKLFSYGFGGIVYCYDIKNGDLLWNFSTNPGGLEGPYPNWPIRSDFVIADGKVYFTTGEHSHTDPLLRGWTGYCVDIETGKGLWNITGLWSTGSIADGYYVNFDNMDNQIYVFGKGQTATTVFTSPEVSVQGNNVLIKGTVTDQSPGAKGTPAIADNDMTAWMEYLYHQRQMPANAKGVEVTIDTIDPNGNFVHIGDTTSDTSGLYSYVFTPDIPGKYTIIATFGGSVSYFALQAETAMAVSEATATASPYPVVNLPPTEMTSLQQQPQ